MLRVRPLEPFGAEVAGFQLSASPDPAAVRSACVRHRILVFREQRASDGELAAFLASLGPPMYTAGEPPVAGAPQLNIVSNIGRTTPPRSVFHTDTSYVARPPAFTALKSVVLPEAGGGTLFSDQVRAAARLPTRCREWLAGKTLEHSATGPDGVDYAVRHPVLRRLPETGETSLYLSTPERCCNLEGAAQSQRIVDALYRHSTGQAHLYRHQWRDGDVVLFDDRATMHRADHGGVQGNRVLHRGLVEGERPAFAEA